jgi:hypothetical protein
MRSGEQPGELHVPDGDKETRVSPFATPDWSMLVSTVMYLGDSGCAPIAVGTPFASTADWGGTYLGKLDGKHATLTISPVYPIYPPDIWSFTISATDMNGTEYSTQGELIANVGALCHEIPAFALWTDDGGNRINVNRLLLHTWDTDYVSGETEWGGQRYGCVFKVGGI